jgi:energy-coupling factor transporter ATP-binding protein EcfA2
MFRVSPRLEVAFGNLKVCRTSTSTSRRASSSSCSARRAAASRRCSTASPACSISSTARSGSGDNVTWKEPKDRGIGMVFQSYALYPQMTVEGNLSFGLKNGAGAEAEIEKRIKRAAEILQIGRC